MSGDAPRHAVHGYDVHGTFEVQDDRAMGWCWSRQRPAEALRVEVLSDGRVVGSGIAARHVPELVRPGVTGGYHGYLFMLPEGLPPSAILEAREARTGRVFARRLPRTLPDVLAWQRRVAELGRAVSALHDGFGETIPGAAPWSAAWGFGGARLAPPHLHAGRAALPGLALRPVDRPLWTVILDLPRARPASGAPGHGASVTVEAASAAARREVTALGPLLAPARAELVVIDDGRAAGFLAAVAGLRIAAVPPGAGDVARLSAAMALARGAHLAIFAPITAPVPLAAPATVSLTVSVTDAGPVVAPGPAPDTLRGRAALLAGPVADRVLLGGGVASAIRGAGLEARLPAVERDGADTGTGAEPNTGLLLLAPRAVCEAVGALDPAMDDGADLALLDFALRARAAGSVVRVMEDARPARSGGVDAVGPRRAFMERWK